MVGRHKVIIIKIMGTILNSFNICIKVFVELTGCRRVYGWFGHSTDTLMYKIIQNRTACLVYQQSWVGRSTLLVEQQVWSSNHMSGRATCLVEQHVWRTIPGIIVKSIPSSLMNIVQGHWVARFWGLGIFDAATWTIDFPLNN